LVDDTPLAFLHQPCNGVPVLGFRGDPDDRLLMEAVLPLLQVGGLLRAGCVCRSLAQEGAARMRACAGVEAAASPAPA
jgi:hypothetical protein